MSKIQVTRRHDWGIEGARAEVQRIAERMRQEFGADYAWDGDRLRFWRSGIHGRIDITDDGLDLRIKLGLLLSPMKGQIEQRIVAKIDEKLARRHGGDDL